jgi:acyl dehydratase
LSELEQLQVTFSSEQIAEYAAASGDRNPIHLDVSFARTVGLPGVIAHGMLQMGLLTRVAVDGAGGDPRRLRSLSCRFAAMVLPGDTVTFGGRSGEAGELELWARNQRGEAVLTKAAAEVTPG